jgi:hypothetical protein
MVDVLDSWWSTTGAGGVRTQSFVDVCRFETIGSRVFMATSLVRMDGCVAVSAMIADGGTEDLWGPRIRLSDLQDVGLIWSVLDALGLRLEAMKAIVRRRAGVVYLCFAVSCTANFWELRIAA